MFLSERLCALANDGRHAYQRIDELLLDFEMTLVFGEISTPVRLVQHSPLLTRQVDRVLQALKHDVAILGAITVPQVIELLNRHCPSQRERRGRRRELVSERYCSPSCVG